jgi:hypothetical protein
MSCISFFLFLSPFYTFYAFSSYPFLAIVDTYLVDGFGNILTLFCSFSLFLYLLSATSLFIYPLLTIRYTDDEPKPKGNTKQREKKRKDGAEVGFVYDINFNLTGGRLSVCVRVCV